MIYAVKTSPEDKIITTPQGNTSIIPQYNEINYFFLPPFFAFLALAFPEFCFLLLAEPAPPEPFLPLFGDLDIALYR